MTNPNTKTIEALEESRNLLKEKARFKTADELFTDIDSFKAPPKYERRMKRKAWLYIENLCHRTCFKNEIISNILASDDLCYGVRAILKAKNMTPRRAKKLIECLFDELEISSFNEQD